MELNYDTGRCIQMKLSRTDKALDAKRLKPARRKSRVGNRPSDIPRVLVAFRIELPLKEEIDRLCDRLNITRSFVIEEALRYANLEEVIKARLSGKYELAELGPDDKRAIEALSGEILEDGATLIVGELDDEEFEMLGILTDVEQRVIRAMYYNFCVPGERISPTGIARLAGISKTKLDSLMSDDRFIAALDIFMNKKLRAAKYDVMNSLYETAMKGSVAASKFFLILAGDDRAIPRSMSMNVSVDAGDMRGKSREEVKEAVVAEWKKQGWGKEEFEELWGEGKRGDK